VATPRAAAPSQCGLRGELRGGSGVASGKVWGGGGSPCGEATARGGGNDGRQHSTAASGLRWLATSVGRSCSMRPTIGVRRGGKNQHGQGPGMKLTEGQGRGGGGGGVGGSGSSTPGGLRGGFRWWSGPEARGRGGHHASSVWEGKTGAGKQGGDATLGL
jgi:hypothetical protein